MKKMNQVKHLRGFLIVFLFVDVLCYAEEIERLIVGKNTKIEVSYPVEAKGDVAKKIAENLRNALPQIKDTFSQTPVQLPAQTDKVFFDLKGKNGFAEGESNISLSLEGLEFDKNLYNGLLAHEYTHNVFDLNLDVDHSLVNKYPYSEFFSDVVASLYSGDLEVMSELFETGKRQRRSFSEKAQNRDLSKVGSSVGIKPGRIKENDPYYPKYNLVELATDFFHKARKLLGRYFVELGGDENAKKYLVRVTFLAIQDELKRLSEHAKKHKVRYRLTPFGKLENILEAESGLYLAIKKKVLSDFPDLDEQTRRECK